MAISKDFLDSIFSSDSLGLIDKVELPKKSVHEDFDVGDSKRKEIQDWMELHNREPDYNSKDPTEKMLAARLRRIKDDSAPEPKKDDDPLHSEALDRMIAMMGDDKGIHDFSGSLLKKAGEKKQKTMALYTSRRIAAKEFRKYEPMFQRVQAEIESKARKVVSFDGKAGAHKDRFYIAGGILCFVDEIYDKEEVGNLGQMDRRIHVIFANGTENFMLYRSFLRLMSTENGRAVMDVETDENIQDFQLSGEDDVTTGYIYILRTTSDEPIVRQFGGRLYKVGYTGRSVEERIQNAENEPTYLCAPVVIEETWRCTNLNAKALESFMHKFFQKARVPITVNVKGKQQTVREWFNVPLETLEQVAKLIINGDIRNWRYDHVSGELVRRR